MITKFTIYGERCTGTNFVRKLMVDNFSIDLVSIPTRPEGHKHFFGSLNNRYAIQDSKTCAILAIVRNPIDTLVSFYEHPHHQPKERCHTFVTFLTSEFYSVNNLGEEMMHDHNMKTRFKVRYRDIFEMRSVKNRFLVSELPKLTPNSYFMRYEELKANPEKIIGEIASKFGLSLKNDHVVVEKRRVQPQGGDWDEFTLTDAPIMDNYVVQDPVARDIIKARLDFECEELVGYDKNAIMMRLA